MQLSQNTQQLFADFFSDLGLCRREEFPVIEVYVRRGSRLLTNVLMVDGITFGRHIFINPRLAERDKQSLLRIPKTLMAHEIAHVVQYRRKGSLRFLFNYARDFWRIFRKKEKWDLRSWFDSYLEIPHEIEARKAASEFPKWLLDQNEGLSN
ncbi:MAG: DUF4157 domain-containing protein [Pyrinomonadaceae bacterium]